MKQKIKQETRTMEDIDALEEAKNKVAEME